MSQAVRILGFAVVLAASAATARAEPTTADEAKPTDSNRKAQTRSWKPTGKWKLQGHARPATGKSEPPPVAKTAATAAAPSTDGKSSTVESNQPKTVVVPPGAPPAAPAPPPAAPADLGDCDYWIVSSRGCNGSVAPSDVCRCLTFFHQTSSQNLACEPGQAFLASIRPDRPVCFVVHGSYNKWRDVVGESRRIHHWLRGANPASPLQVVFFTWPSDGKMPLLLPVDIAILGRRSAAHGVYLASLTTQLPPQQQVCIVGHSHGARAAVAAMHLLGGGRLEEGQCLPAGCSCPPHLRAVLIAAAIDHNWLNPGQRYGQALVIPERVLLMRNSRDSWLTMYPARKAFGERALGKDGLGQDDRLALGPLGSKVVELNAADFATWHHSFSEFHQRPELATAMLPYVYFQEDAPPPPGPALAAPTATPTPAGTP